MSAVNETVLLTAPSQQQWSHDLNSGCICIIDRVTLSIVYVTVVLTGSPCHYWMCLCYF